MKKLFLLAGLLLVSGSAYAQHQKGDVAVGGNLAFYTSGSNLGIGAKAQYGLTDRIRLEANATYFLPKNEANSLEAGLVGHYLFPLKDSKFTLYPLAGIGYYHNSSKVGETTFSTGNLLINFGGGAAYQVTPTFALGAEAKYLLVSGLNSPEIGINAMFKL